VIGIGIGIWSPNGSAGTVEVLVKVLKEYAKRCCCWVIVLREKIVALLIMTTE
jgi:hypothetical protein